jgi:hypothetical protein
MRIAMTARAVPLLAALAAGSLIAGCAGSSSPASAKPASSVIPAMEAAVDQATSVHMTGQVTAGGIRTGFDIKFHGSQLAGSMNASGASFDLIVVRGKTYIKVDSSFLTRSGIPATLCTKICGKYFLLPITDAQSITGTLSMTRLTRDLFGKIPKSAKKSGVMFKPATYEGQSVLRVRKDGFTLDVAASGKPYPLAILAPHGQYLKFSDWNSVPSPSAPARSEVVSTKELDQLAHSDD